MTTISCLPEDMADLPGSDVRFDLYSNSRIGSRGRVGDLVPGRLRRQGLRPSAVAWDFTSFALSAVAADEAVSRERSPDGWTREIELTLAVTNPDLWKTQRGRLTEALRFLSGDIWSLEFVGHGTCLAKHRDGSPVELRIPENGFISQNVPLTPMRTGSLSTRTTHPYFLRLIQDTLDDVGLRINLNNPYETTTKGEMLVGCSDQGLLSGLAGLSTSCGRYSRTGFRHCGRCVPCQVRRGAYLAWGHPDDTTNGYKYDDLSLNDSKHARFDDVRSVAIAIETVRARGIDELIGGAMNGQLLGKVQPYRGVVDRGIA